MKLACIFVLIVLTSCVQTGRSMQLTQLTQLLQRIARQTGRYGVPPGYRPGLGYSVNVRNGVNPGVKSAPPSGGRPQGVGGYSFGGVASGRPAYGSDFVVNAGGAAAQKPQRYAVARPQPNTVYRPGGTQIVGSSSGAGGGGRPIAAYQYS